MSEELKACPFCKCTEIVAGKDYTRGNYRVDCLGCSAFITAPSLELAIQYWNTRPIEDKLRAELDRLIDDNAKFQEMATRKMTDLRAELARRDEIITRLKEDGERMADFFIEGERGNSEVFVCIYCDAPPKFKNRKLEHEEYCPVSKHDALMKELE